MVQPLQKQQGRLLEALPLRREVDPGLRPLTMDRIRRPERLGLGVCGPRRRVHGPDRTASRFLIRSNVYNNNVVPKYK